MRTIVSCRRSGVGAAEKIVPSATAGSTWSSTRCLPNDLPTRRARIAASSTTGHHPSFQVPSAGVVDRLQAGRRRGVPDGARSTPARAVAAARREVDSANAANSSSTARRSRGLPASTSRPLRLFRPAPISETSNPTHVGGGSIDADPVHPLLRRHATGGPVRGSPTALTAPAIALRLAKSARPVRWMLCCGGQHTIEVPQELAHHHGHPNALAYKRPA